MTDPNITLHTAPAYRAPDGPHWMPRAQVGDPQNDGRGVRWVITAVEQGGRVLRWRSWGDARVTVTEATPTHPDYPTDADVLAATRADRRAERARWR